jgi:diguanylate cyclase (GGDEF)-like protein/PAS domain S-box-containing protein
VGDDALRGGDKRLLIVDDENIILDILKEHLDGKGFECVVASSSKDALERLREAEAGLLLTDIVMPEMGGIDLAEAARNLWPDLGVIVMTGKSDATHAIAALRAGADDYILKPFDFEEMLFCIDRALEKRRLVKENREYRDRLEEKIHEATTDLAVTNARLSETERYLNNLINSTVDGIITVAPDEKITFANRGAHLMFGYGGMELQGLAIANLYVGGLEEAKYVRRVISVDRPLQNYETELKHRDGRTIPVNMSVSVVPGAEEQPSSILLICKDITEQKRLEQELKEMTIRDGLTGLYNLRFFYERLEAEIERAKRQKHPLSLLLLDIDRFKSYNDAHGHLEGDRVLREVGRVISESTREHVDLGFRYGGDEFMVILPEASEETSLRIAHRIRETFAARRFDLLTMSVGLMSYQDSYSPRTFIQFTDSMMYDAKRSGGNQVTVYRTGDYVKNSEADTPGPNPA